MIMLSEYVMMTVEDRKRIPAAVFAHTGGDVE